MIRKYYSKFVFKTRIFHLALMEERNEELPRSNGTFQHPSSSALPGNYSQHPLPETNQDHVNADTEDQKPQGNCRGYKTYCTGPLPVATDYSTIQSNLSYHSKMNSCLS
jgi:hypothetical protein